MTTSHARRRIVGVIAALSAIGALGGAATAQARMDVGIQDDAVFLNHNYYRTDWGYSQARGIGARWVRVNVLWSDYVRYGFSRYDRMVGEARGAGMNVQMTITGTPQYDASGDKRLSYSNPDPKRYANFAVAIARHFRGRVFRYSIWNEPNLPRWLGTKNSPKAYRQLVLKGYPALKSVDKRNTVLIGELTSAHNPLGFLGKAAAGLKADGLAYHPFQFYTEPGHKPTKRDKGFVGLSETGRVQSLLRSLSRSHKLTTKRGGTLPIYFTEFGYLSHGVYQMPESRRTKWTLEAFQVAKRYGVKEMLYYQLVHSPTGTLAGDIWDSGIVNLDGTRTAPYNNLYNHRKSYT